jgi:hypothetical protein
LTVRLRGLDSDDVRYLLAGLAGQLKVIQAQLATLTHANETLRQENQLLHSESWRSPARPLTTWGEGTTSGPRAMYAQPFDLLVVRADQNPIPVDGCREPISVIQARLAELRISGGESE